MILFKTEPEYYHILSAVNFLVRFVEGGGRITDRFNFRGYDFSLNLQAHNFPCLQSLTILSMPHFKRFGRLDRPIEHEVTFSFRGIKSNASLIYGCILLNQFRFWSLLFSEFAFLTHSSENGWLRRSPKLSNTKNRRFSRF